MRLENFEILSQSDSVGAKFEQAAITPKRYEIGCQLLLVTNRKSHTGFRLVIWSPSSSVLLLAKTITYPAARSLCDS